MTRKEQILRFVQKLDEDVSFDRVIYHLSVMKGVEIGLQQAERGEGMEHDEFFERLLAEEWPESKSVGPRKRKTTSGKSSETSAENPPRGSRKRSPAG